MASKNPHFRQLISDSTYTEIVSNQILKQVEAHQAAYPEQKIYMMGFGDTSQPLPATVVKALVDAASRLGHPETYTGYEDITGNPELRRAICLNYYQNKLGITLDPTEVFVSDGAQSVAVNLQELLAEDNIVALQNPAYPSFVEGTLLAGRTQYLNLHCHEQNNFVPEIPEQKVDLIYLCFPNNPTGTVATREQLKAFVDYARTNQALIIFDAVYSPFITTPNIPRSIYEIEGATQCAVEIGSFSKMANFTGLRVGWCIVPHTLTISNTAPGELNQMWKIRHSIKFWGTANVAQQGAIAALSEEGQQECQEVVNYYLKNAQLLRAGLETAGLKCFGGIDNPFIWLKAPQGMQSWQFFEKLMQETGIVGIPGCLFGSSGEGYLRLSTLIRREKIEEAVNSCSQ
ncbi:MAG: LL-diaminopimelate aminotransferase [Symploca sp. SIO1B1]|nr:LL-diaminopimelate aminotransferase [Symploca sp. SIO1B1]